jgi:hypothetical protein
MIHSIVIKIDEPKFGQKLSAGQANVKYQLHKARGNFRLYEKVKERTTRISLLIEARKESDNERERESLGRAQTACK